MTRAEHVEGLQLSLRAALAAGLSVGLSQALNLKAPLVALITACLVTDLDPQRTRHLGLPRMAGTVLGALLGALSSAFLGSGGVAVGLGAFAAMFLCQELRLNDAAARVGGYVCGIVLLNHGHDPWTYALHRVLETLLGILMAILLSYLPRLLPTGGAPASSSSRA